MDSSLVLEMVDKMISPYQIGAKAFRIGDSIKNVPFLPKTVSRISWENSFRSTKALHKRGGR